MTPQVDKAKAIFLKAVEEHRQEAWPSNLDEACDGDARLRAQVQQLLKAQSQLPGGEIQLPAEIF